MRSRTGVLGAKNRRRNAASWCVSAPPDDAYRRAPVRRWSVRIEIRQDDRQVLGVGQEAHDVGVVRSHEVEPADWKARNSSEPKPGDVTQLADAWRSRIGHLLEGSQRCNSSIEEAHARVDATLSPVVPGAFDEISLGQRSQPGDGHDSAANA